MTGESVNLFGMYEGLQDSIRADYAHEPRVIASKIEYARTYRDHAQWYAWGRMDEGTAVTVVYGRRVDAAWEFGYMVGILALLYAMERRYSLPSLRSAWLAFKAGIDIDQYVI